VLVGKQGIKSMGLRFEWDRRKAAANLRKYGVSFDEASTVFHDLSAESSTMKTIRETNRDRSIVGHSEAGRLLLVSLTERAENVIRIISAPLTNKRERDDYEKNQSD
jgi:uncharacterized DUF497 family protein